MKLATACKMNCALSNSTDLLLMWWIVESLISWQPSDGKITMTQGIGTDFVIFYTECWHPSKLQILSSMRCPHGLVEMPGHGLGCANSCSCDHMSDNWCQVRRRVFCQPGWMEYNTGPTELWWEGSTADLRTALIKTCSEVFNYRQTSETWVQVQTTTVKWGAK